MKNEYDWCKTLHNTSSIVKVKEVLQGTCIQYAIKCLDTIPLYACGVKCNSMQGLAFEFSWSTKLPTMFYSKQVCFLAYQYSSVTVSWNYHFCPLLQSDLDEIRVRKWLFLCRGSLVLQTFARNRHFASFFSKRTSIFENLDGSYFCFTLLGVHL